MEENDIEDDHPAKMLAPQNHEDGENDENEFCFDGKSMADLNEDLLKELSEEDVRVFLSTFFKKTQGEDKFFSMIFDTLPEYVQSEYENFTLWVKIKGSMEPKQAYEFQQKILNIGINAGSNWAKETLLALKN